MYNNNETNKKAKMIIPPQLFKIPKKLLVLQVPICKVYKRDQRNFWIILQF